MSKNSLAELTEGTGMSTGSSVSTPGSGKPAVFQIAEVYFKALSDAKITHLINRNKVLATHQALGIFYDEMSDLLDSFIEASAGIYPLDALSFSAEEIKDCVSYFTKVYDSVESLRKSIPQKFIQSDIDVLQKEVGHCLYRLKYITT